MSEPLIDFLRGMIMFVGILTTALGITLAFVPSLRASPEKEAAPPEAELDDENWHKMV